MPFLRAIVVSERFGSPRLASIYDLTERRRASWMLCSSVDWRSGSEFSAKRDEIHELLAELRSRGLVQAAALDGKGRAKFGGDAAKPAREIEILELRRTAGIEPAIKSRARKLYPELTRLDIATQFIGFVGVV